MTDTYLPRILIDFDDTIHDYSGSGGWKGHGTIPGDPLPGAMAWLASLVDKFEVCVYSTRSAQVGGLRAMERWFRFHWDDAGLGALPLDEAGELKIKFPETKLPAKLTIDDRAIRFTGKFPPVASLLFFTTWAETPAVIGDHERKHEREIARRADHLMHAGKSYRELAAAEWMRPEWAARMIDIADQVDELAAKIASIVPPK